MVPKLIEVGSGPKGAVRQAIMETGGRKQSIGLSNTPLRFDGRPGRALRNNGTL